MAITFKVGKFIPNENGQGGVEYLLMLSVIIAVAALVAYYVLTGYSSMAYSTSTVMVKGASAACKEGLSPWSSLPQ